MKEKWPDFKTTPYLAAEDLDGEEIVLTIASVGEDVFEEKGVDVQKPILNFTEQYRGRDKSLVLNATNRALLQDMFGVDVAGCISKRITIYPTTTSYGKKVVPCLRIKEPPAEPDVGRDG